MAKVTQVGPGRKTTGTIDGITYVTRNGVTYARSTPTMPASVYNTPAAKKRQAIFKFVQMHLKLHLRTIKQTFTPKGNGTPTNRYYSINGKALTLALDTLAELYCAGQDVTIDDVEQAISDYAAANPKSIKIASKSGYQDVFLTGPWPETITLNALAGDSTVIIIVNEYGQQTTINADGSVTVAGGGSNTNGTNNTNGGSTGSETGGGSNTNGTNNTNSGNSSGSGGDNTGGNSGGNTGSVTPSNPKLTINRSGTGTSTVSVNGSGVNSGAEIEANTEVSISITPAEGATPTVSLNGNAVTLTENDGVYSGSFQMPNSNATLVINSGGTTGGGSGDMN
ncbi:MAG: hypothetical protein K6G08_07400 [Prevotella sp.]|nr:hypothetical protein [Prevotella sp.]